MSMVRLPQPFGFYHILTDTDDLHFGYWPEDRPGIPFSQAQQALTDLLFGLFPQPPAHILDVGCGLGATAGDLSARGYEVVAIAPSQELIAFAEQHHPGPRYLPCGFLEDNQLLNSPQYYDLVLFQESLQYFPQLVPVFQKAKRLLAAQGRMVLCDEVSYSPRTRDKSAVHSAGEIERCLGETGFCIRRHKRIGPQVIQTCREILKLFEKKETVNRDIRGGCEGSGRPLFPRLEETARMVQYRAFWLRSLGCKAGPLYCPSLHARR